jgi:1-aminocyclopropane-1-carboxylate deaminase/D-cysteine desulfhydrase-like pyridoxal-dependent ACC family enzyme
MSELDIPIEKYNEFIDIKRDDLYGSYDDNIEPYNDGMGCKTRGIILSIDDAKDKNFKGIVTSATKNSNAARILSYFCNEEKLKCTIIIPKLKELSSSFKIAKSYGSELIESKFCRTQYLDFLAKKYAKENNYYYLEQGCSNSFLFDCYETEGKYVINNYDNVFITVGTGTIFGGLSKGLRNKNIKCIGLSLVKTEEQIKKFLKKKFSFELINEKESIIQLPKQKNIIENPIFDINYSLLAWNWLINNIELYKTQRNLFWNTGNNLKNG